METLGAVTGSQGAIDQDCITTPNAAAAVVYQLVRVDGDGKLVPATDDEVIAVEGLLEDDKSKNGTAVTVQTLECSTSYACGGCATDEFSQPLLEFLGPKMANVLPASMTESQGTDSQHKFAVQEIPATVPSISGGCIYEPRSLEDPTEVLGGSENSKTSSSAIRTDLKPDFSLLTGEILLENLSVSDLQETFKATFGRATSVRDKQWLKRRIIMGLTNTCDFSTTSFLIIDNKVVKKVNDDTHNSLDYSGLVECVVTSADGDHENLSTCHDKEVEVHSIANGTKRKRSITQDESCCEATDIGQRSAKRVRKPTKRFIEELSVGESRDSDTKIVSSVKRSDDRPHTEVCARPTTRKYSLAGWGLQVPHVSRIRRCRPRENYMAFMKLQQWDLDVSARLEKNDVASSEELANECGDERYKSNFPPAWIQDPDSMGSDRPCTERDIVQLDSEVKPRIEELSLHKNSDDMKVVVPNVTGGTRRKHHRPWTLSEVVKLVEGVAKYGAGRWSDIKRLAFTSCSYRTSVDLKDKWRNLLKASIAESPLGNGIYNPRKQSSAVIPAPILSRVRELAEITQS